MYIELFVEGKAYRGELISEAGNTIIFRSLLDDNIVTIDLPHVYTLYSYTDKSDEQLNYKVEHIISSKEESIFTEDDINLIANSYNVVTIYRTLHSLRSLDFKFNTLEEITLQSLKEKVKHIIEREYKSNLEYINSDTDLTLEEGKKLIDAIDRAKEDYYNILNITNNIIEVLDAFPPMFNETLPYISEIIKYIKHNEEIANIIRSADTQTR